jgi:hypothetical protein
VWWWILIWVLLVIAAAAFLGLVAWSVIKRGIRLGRQVGDSAELVGAALEPVMSDYRPDPSVLVDPSAFPDAPKPAARRRGHSRG